MKIQIKIFTVLMMTLFTMPSLADINECAAYINNCTSVKKATLMNNCDDGEKKIPGLSDYFNKNGKRLFETTFYAQIMQRFCPDTYNACVNSGGKWTNEIDECVCPTGKPRQQHRVTKVYTCVSQDEKDCNAAHASWVNGACQCKNDATWNTGEKTCVCNNSSYFYAYDKGCIPDPAKQPQKQPVDATANVSSTHEQQSQAENEAKTNLDYSPKEACVNVEHGKWEDTGKIKTCLCPESNEIWDSAHQICVTEDEDAAEEEKNQKDLEKIQKKQEQQLEVEQQFKRDFMDLHNAFRQVLEKINNDCAKEGGKISSDGTKCEKQEQ